MDRDDYRYWWESRNQISGILIFIASSNLVGIPTGRSPGFAPLSIRPDKTLLDGRCLFGWVHGKRGRQCSQRTARDKLRSRVATQQIQQWVFDFLLQKDRAEAKKKATNGTLAAICATDVGGCDHKSFLLRRLTIVQCDCNYHEDQKDGSSLAHGRVRSAQRTSAAPNTTDANAIHWVIILAS